MQTLLRVLWIVVFGFSISGCMSKGFNRGELKHNVGVLRSVYDDKEIEEAFKKKANLPKPFKLGVYFRAPKGFLQSLEWRWTDKDKEIFKEIAQLLKTDGLASEVFPIIDSLVAEDDLRSLRLVAAKHHADALLIISGGAQIDRYINKWGWSYILLAPTFFVRGSKADTLFYANATLWDVKNEFLYLTAEAESVSSKTYVAMFGKSDKELVDDAKGEALTKLKAELQAMLKGTKL